MMVVGMAENPPAIAYKVREMNYNFTYSVILNFDDVLPGVPQ